jgi:prepilin-type N-terminal cleavage/methylation domain-containing protein
MKGNIIHTKHKGFTIIEVMIFLAISGLLLVGVLIGTGTTIARQRYNDAVQSFAEFLRQQYSFVINPQIAPFREFSGSCETADSSKIFDFASPSQTYLTKEFLLSFYDSSTPPKYVGRQADATSNRGQSDCVLYGIMITFSEDGRMATRTPLIGRDFPKIKEEYEKGSTKRIEDIKTDPLYPELINVPLDLAVLSLAGIGGGMPSVTVTDMPSTLPAAPPGNPDNINRFFGPNSNCMPTLVGPPNSESFLFRYGASVKGISVSNPLPDAIFIVRSPLNGTVKTYSANNFKYAPEIEFNGNTFSSTEDFNKNNTANLNNSGGGNCSGNLGTGRVNAFLTLIDNLSISKKFGNATYPKDGEGEIPLCLYSDDVFAYADRQRMIAITENGRNPTAINLVDSDSDRNLCGSGGG